MTFGGAAPSVASASAMIMHMRIEIGAKVEEDGRTADQKMHASHRTSSGQCNAGSRSVVLPLGFSTIPLLILLRIFENFD